MLLLPVRSGSHTLGASSSRACLRLSTSITADASGVSDCAGRTSSRGTIRARTSTKTPIDRGSVTRCDGRGVNRGKRSGSRASPGGRLGAALPRVRGPLDQADRRPSRSLSGDSQGVLLRPHGGEGAGGQGPLPRRMPRVRRLHPVAEREGRRLRLRLLQGVPPGRDRAPLDARGLRRCVRGERCTAGSRHRTTGPQPTPAGVAAKRCGG